MVRMVSGATVIVVALAFLTSPALAQTTVSGEARVQHSHNINPGPFSPFFSFAQGDNGDPFFFTDAAGLAGSLISGNGDTTTVSGTITIVGNSNAITSFTDGNRLPNGITLTYDVSFTISTTDGVLVTAGGNTGNGLGPGTAPFDAFDPGESVTISAATISNVSFAGMPIDPDVTFTPGSVSGIAFDLFRSGNFNETDNGAILDNGVDSVGFGASVGSLASNAIMDNNFNGANRFPPMLLDVPMTLTMDNSTTGTFNLKGFETLTFFDYEFTAPKSNTRVALTQHSHNINPGPFSPFFTQATGEDGTVYDFTAAAGLSGSIVAGASDTTTVSGTIEIVGNATQVNDFLDGNQLPEGVTLSYDLSFNVSSPDGLLTTSGTNTGNGLGIGPDQYESINNGEQLVFSPAVISNVTFSGQPIAKGVMLVPGDVEDVAFDIFRSNSFAEATEGAVLSNGMDSVGFGLAMGSLASEVDMDNGFTAADRFPAISILDMLTLTADSDPATDFHLKGFETATFFSYELIDDEILLGDVNCDGFVNILDIAPFVSLITDGGFNVKADINGDGFVDLLDVAPFVEILTGG